MASAIALSSSLFLHWTMCTLPLCFSLSLANRDHKKQSSLKSNPAVDDLVSRFAESVFGGLSLFSGLVYILLYSVCTSVPAITRKECAFFSAYMLIPAASFSLNASFSWSPESFWQIEHNIFGFHFSMHTKKIEWKYITIWLKLLTKDNIDNQLRNTFKSNDI